MSRALHFAVVRGRPDEAELAAVTAVLLARLCLPERPRPVTGAARTQAAGRPVRWAAGRRRGPYCVGWAGN